MKPRLLQVRTLSTRWSTPAWCGQDIKKSRSHIFKSDFQCEPPATRMKTASTSNLHEVCSFSLCVCGFSPGAPVSSHTHSVNKQSQCTLGNCVMTFIRLRNTTSVKYFLSVGFRFSMWNWTTQYFILMRDQIMWNVSVVETSSERNNSWQRKQTLYTICSAPNSRQTQLETSWWT